MDFSITKYKSLLTTLVEKGFFFQTFTEYIEKPHRNPMVLRHDVDKLPKNSLLFANIQASKGIKGTYYFRIVPESFDKEIILQIAKMGHEIGYHYETIDTVAHRYKKEKKKLHIRIS